MHLSIVIPVYHSATTLDALTRRLLMVLDTTGLQYEIVFVEDGSQDESWPTLEQIQLQHPDRVTIVQLMRNYGQHNALMCGFRRCQGEYIITMDDDLQNLPEDIPKLLEAIKCQDRDLVYGVPKSKRHTNWRNLGSRMVNMFYRTVFSSSTTVTSFRIIRRPLLESIFSYNLNFTFVDGLLAWNTQRIGEVEVEHRPRVNGRSGYSLRKLMVLAFNLFTNFSLLPLQLVSILGFFTAASGLLLAVIYLTLYLMDAITVPGYASIIITILVLGGMQMLSLGIIGEYLGRLHLNVNRKPQYVERDLRIAKPTVAPRKDPATEPDGLLGMEHSQLTPFA